MVRGSYFFVIMKHHTLTKISDTKTVDIGHCLSSIKQYLFRYHLDAMFQKGIFFPYIFYTKTVLKHVEGH